jgi:hypothetical protein
MAAFRRGETREPEPIQVEEQNERTGRVKPVDGTNESYLATICQGLFGSVLVILILYFVGYGAHVYYLSQCSNYWWTSGTWMCQVAVQIIASVNSPIRTLTQTAGHSLASILQIVADSAARHLIKWVF